VTEVEPGAFSFAGFDLEAHETRHSMPCLAYRFGERFAFSGDSEAFDELAAFADGVSAFVHDCSFPDGVDVSNHPTPSQLGAVLAGHEYGTVFLTHLYPHTDGEHGAMLESLGEHYDGEVRFAEDGLTVEA
jgi:ribonuclease BN (tRNA processing enzyme)